jgi:uncharacterized HAD superfamily protein
MITGKKPVIAVDCDEVLCYFTQSLMDFHNHHYETSLILDDFHHFDLHLVWGGTKEDTNKKFEHFYTTDFFKNISPIKNAYVSLKQLKERYSFVVVTARDHSLLDHTKAFLDQHYPDIFDQVLTGNHYGQGKRHTKQELCEQVGAILLIDDNIGYINECTKHGIKGVVFGQYPWNKNFKIEHPDVKRVSRWDEVDHEFVLSVIE